MPRTESKLGRHLAGSAAAFACAVGLALAAAHYYEVPTLNGVPTHSAWFESDTLYSLASSLVALAIGIATRRSATSPGALAAGSPTLRVLIWAGFTVCFLAVWAHSLFLFTLLIAPAHAFAALRLLGLWTRWR
jgi:hypothetical protein